MISTKKIAIVALLLMVAAAIIPATQAQSITTNDDNNTIQPYHGWIGADSPLYGLKIFFQNLDVSLASGSTDKMQKQMNYADDRLSEMLAAQDANNTGAFAAAADQYEALLDRLNNTTQDDGINDSAYADMDPMLIHHKEVFYAMMNNSTGCTPLLQNRLLTMCNDTDRVKNGMPFFYINGTQCFVPPGEMKKMHDNSSFVPPGLAKKGYVRPIGNGSPAWPIDNGSPAWHMNNSTNMPGRHMNNSTEWPWDNVKFPMNQTHSATGMPGMGNGMPGMNNGRGNDNGNSKNDDHGNGNSNGNSNGNGNGNGHK